MYNVLSIIIAIFLLSIVNLVMNKNNRILFHVPQNSKTHKIIFLVSVTTVESIVRSGLI